MLSQLKNRSDMNRIKDQQYWKEYNSKRREYNRLKQQEYRARLKVADSKENIPVADMVSLVADRVEQSLVADKVADIQPSQKVADSPKVADKLWSDYYNCKKPFCSGCQQQNIPDDQYAFCSQEKDTSDPDFKNIYFCQVYHWTIYQGKANQSKSKPLLPPSG